jgi:hypothetical protein
MRPDRRRWILGALCAPWALSSTACSPRTPAMTPEEAHLVQKLTARMRTRCIGRHLIDLPEDFVLNPVDRVEIEGVEVSIRPLPRAGFDYQLERRTEELRNETILGEPTPSLREIRPLPPASE